MKKEGKKENKKNYQLMQEKESRNFPFYGEDFIGSHMTKNFICLREGMSIKEATKSLIAQAPKKDNLNTLYVVDTSERLVGAIDLKDLIVAREYDDLDSLIDRRYPFVYATEEIQECVSAIQGYGEESLPVVDLDKTLVGIITATDILEMVGEELGEDYARLAGMTAAGDLHESSLEGMKKRMPWLILLLFLGMVVSSVVGLYETIVAQVAILVSFQSLILDMAGNVGTQSLAVTIRILMDEEVSRKEKLLFTLKELKLGTYNGLLLGALAFLFVGMYVTLVKEKPVDYAFTVSGCVSLSLLVAMIISSLVGVLTPIFFHKINIDPAVASGPLITTINDLVAVITYYSFAWLLLVP